MDSGQKGMKQLLSSVKSMYQSRSEDVHFHKSFVLKTATVNIKFKENILNCVYRLFVIACHFSAS